MTEAPKIYPAVTLTDLRHDLIERCRKQAGVWREGHPWIDMDDMQLLQSAQLHQTDPDTGKSGITLAGILLLGNDQLILSAVPHHRTDLIVRKVDLDRYDDRDLVRTNLLDSYDRIIAFVRKHLPDPFHLEGMVRISIRDAIFREIASNILIHREYTNAFPAKLIIERGWVRTENSSKPHGFGALNPATFTPFPKNPVIGAFFREIHRADELGSGMRKLMRYGKVYGGADPEMVEGDIFRISVAVPDFAGHGHEGHGGAKEVTPEVRRMLGLMTGEMTRAEIQEALGLKDEKHFRENYQQIAVKLGLIEMTIPDKPRSSRQRYRLTDKGHRILG